MIPDSFYQLFCSNTATGGIRIVVLFVYLLQIGKDSTSGSIVQHYGSVSERHPLFSPRHCGEKRSKEGQTGLIVSGLDVSKEFAYYEV